METDRLKQILRRTRPLGLDRQENAAEHSWQLALMAMLLAEYADCPVNLERVLKLVLVHDVVEVDAGDTFIYDTRGQAGRAARERQAAQRIFGLLPAKQRQEFRGLWEEFEAGVTPEARFAAGLDRLLPILLNYHSGGGSWRKHGISGEQVLNCNSQIQKASRRLWAHTCRLVAEATRHGWLKDPQSIPPPAHSRKNQRSL